MFTSAFHPRTNSKCERLNQTFKHMLTKYVKGQVHSWDEYVDSSLFSCRIRKHATTGYSPFYLVYGQEPVLPGDSRRPFMDPLTEEDPELVAEDVLARIRDLREKRFEAKGGHTDTRNCCTITRTGSGLVDDLRYLLMGIFLAAVMFSGYVYPFKWLFPIFKTARNIWNAGDILYNHILLHPVIH
jgi:hypothetical protein